MRLMGILNVTPDSFFDGGKYAGKNSAVKRAAQMLEEGADLIDVGGESTRPGGKPVSLDEELKRVVPVVRELVRRFPKVQVSVDTQKSEVAIQSLNEGACMLNDVSAFRSDEERMGRALREYRPQVVLMHMQGNPKTMQKAPRYKNAVSDVKAFLAGRVRWAAAKGVPKKKIWIDPGIGFGKTLRHNLELLGALREFTALGCPVLVGCSRKSFIGVLSGGKKSPAPAGERLEGSLAAACWCALQGASALRVHDVGATRKALLTLDAIRQWTW